MTRLDVHDVEKDFAGTFRRAIQGDLVTIHDESGDAVMMPLEAYEALKQQIEMKEEMEDIRALLKGLEEEGEVSVEDLLDKYGVKA